MSAEHQWEHAGLEDDGPGEPEGDDYVQVGGDANYERRRPTVLTAQSKIADMKKRLKELGKPQYGTKEVVWARLQQAEREHQRTMAEHQERQQQLREGVSQMVEMPKPDEPSPEARATHMLTHLPSASWCEFCCRGKAIDLAHKRVPIEQRGQDPRLELDYSFIKTDGTPAESEESRQVILSMWDEGTNLGQAMSFPSKTYDLNYITKWLAEFVAQLGYVKVILRTDGEPAIKQIAKQLADTLRADKLEGAKGIRAVLQEAPRIPKVQLSVHGWCRVLPEAPEGRHPDNEV